MSDNRERRLREPRAYTGDTIVVPRRRVLREPPNRVPARRSTWRRVRLALLGLLGAGILALVLLYVQVASLAGQLTVDDARPGPVLASPLAGTNLLVLGVDERPGAPQEGVRSDTLMVVHLDSLGRRVSLLSIPRDTRAAVRDVGETKINVAYGYGYANAEALYGPGVAPQQGGMALAAETVEQFLGLPIHYTAQVNFDGFAAVIDALGGVTIDVPRPIRDDEYPTPDFGITTVEFQPGPQRMDGQRALIYARTRHADSDFGRAERQQQVIRAIVDELRARGPLGQALLLGRLQGALDGAVVTTLPFARPDALAGLGWVASGLEPDAIGRYAISPESVPNYREEGSDIVWDPEEVRAAVAEFLAPPSEAAEQARVQVLNGTGETGLARRYSGELESAGFLIIPAGDAPASDVERTVVYDITGKPATSRRLAQLFGAEVRRGAPEGVATSADIVVVLGRNAAE
jgi:polyisoprenyl-teichoic acid--peptidoglycan teichoic acid transferase